MENKKQLGGKRKGAGRKPVLSKKKQISLYVEGSKILKFGNDEKMKSYLYSVIETFGSEIATLTPPSEVNFHGNNIPVSVVDKPKMEEPKSSITGLPPKISDFDNLMDELNACSTIPQVEAVIKKVKSSLMFPREKLIIENHAKEISKDMFND